MVATRFVYRVTLATGVLLVVAPAFAAAPGAGVIDQVVGRFQAEAGGWQGTLQAYALRTFGILAGLELGWSAIKLVFRNADFSEWLAEIISQVMFIGFFYLLLLNSANWGRLIIDSFRQAAGAVGGGIGTTPGDIFGAGVNIGQLVLAQMTIWHIEASAALMIAGIVIVLCFGLIAAWMVVTLVQSYIVVGAGVINMAFGGSRWTKEIAVSTVRHTAAVGAKLMILQLLAAIGQAFVTNWATTMTTMSNADLLIIIGCSVVLAAIVKVVPDEFQRLIDGSSISHGSSLVGAAAAVGGGAAAVGLGMVGAAGMAQQAARLAVAQVGAADAKAAEANGGHAPERSRLSRAAAITGRTAGNLAMAPIRDVGRRLTGDIGARHGSPPWRMSADMSSRRRLLNDDMNKPKPQPAASSENSIS